jgi:hypothetical protein
MLAYKSIQTLSSAKTQFFHCLITHKRTVKKIRPIHMKIYPINLENNLYKKHER